MKQLSEMTTAELRPYAQEFARRCRLGQAGKPRVLAPCTGCAAPLSARERRTPCPHCGARNKRVRAAPDA